jgi:hypothetical protein
MTPDKGQTVQLFLHSNISIEGIVKEWNENQIVLTSGVHHFIVYNPREDLIAAKIMGKSRLSGIVQPSSTPQSTQRPIETPKPIENTIESIDTPLVKDYPEKAQDRQSRYPENVSVEALQHDIAETIASPSGNSLRIKKLGQLRTMLATAEKEVIAGKLTNHNIAPKAETVYANPVQLFKRQ